MKNFTWKPKEVKTTGVISLHTNISLYLDENNGKLYHLIIAISHIIKIAITISIPINNKRFI